MRCTRCVTIVVVGMLALSLLALPQPARAQRERCFLATGHCIRGRFLEVWEQNGGLAVFGFPISAAGNEANRDTGKTYLTQWFERNRFEYHPELSAPYDVLLGRLGDDRLSQQGIDWRDLPRERGPKPDCLWFPQTGHNVCNDWPSFAEGFLTYWQTHGVQDPRLDRYGKSLALFGLPVTEPRRETNPSGDLVWTQWFERARFEWHPDNRAGFKVLLGLLGKEFRDPPPSDLSLYVDPIGLWSVPYPASLLHPEDLGNGTIIFISADRGTVAAVDSYIASGDAFGTVGEGLRQRARETLARIYGRPVQETGNVRELLDRWETGITFTTTGGSQGEAVYQQPGRTQGDYRINGFIYGYKGATGAAMLSTLQLMRDAFKVPSPPAQALLGYFTLLHDGRYREAVHFYGGSYEELREINPDVPPNDHAALFEAACTRQFACLRIRRIVSEEGISAAGGRFEVEFSNVDGTLFTWGPVGGGSGEPETKFRYTVRQGGGRFLVQELPVFVP